ncbi:MAG: succinate dehydrogenase, hydrophobic membrane anchor protein [Chromatiales bacterium]|jgi:succinate dehydrogenase / fumarate reductase membrane anchor subunit
MSRMASGFKAWLVQRITAVYLGLFSIYLLWHFLFDAPGNLADWKGWLLQTPVLISLLVLLLFTLVHAWIGVRDVFIDYVPHTGLRLTLLSLTALLLIFCGTWGLQILLLARLGGS